jgi:hypothetical protein
VNFEALCTEASSLPPEERRRLIAHLVSLQQRHDTPELAVKLAEKIDDPDDSRWFTEEEARKELGMTDGGS